MPDVQFGLSSYKRAEGDLPELPVINMYAEQAPTETGGVVLQSRPPLADRSANMGAGPVRQLYKRDGVLSGALFGVSGSSLYMDTTSLGGINGDGPVSMDGYADLLFAAAGGSLWGYDGSTLAAVTFPDGANVLKVIVGESRAIAIRADTQAFYYSDPLSDNIDGLNFASAESQPDRLLDCLYLDGILILYGAETVEFWPSTGNSDLPFAPLQGRVYKKGIKATGCATKIGSTHAWVTNQNQVCMTEESNIISNVGLEERIEAATNVSLFNFLINGIEMLGLRLDEETQVWSLRSGMWSEFQSYGESNFVPQCWSGGVFGSAIDGKTITWGSGFTDLGGVFERRFRGGFPLNGGNVGIRSLRLRANVGNTGFLSGDYADPQCEMRFSRDAGRTWSQWFPAPLGAQGEYRTRLEWRRLGTFDDPGALFEFRTTDQVPFRVSAVTVNDPGAGRSR